MMSVEDILAQVDLAGDSNAHALTLFSIAVSLNAKNILELGVRGGDTTVPLYMAANHRDGKLTSGS